MGAEDFKEAVNALVSGRKGAILLAGGIDLFVNMKYKVIQSKQIINLKTIPKLEALVEAEESIQVI